jgi:holo-[acyl-carrier protein] synthase
VILGIGSDITDSRRIENILNRYQSRFEDRVFADIEKTRARKSADPAAVYAKRFAAKEACAKALGTGLAGLGGDGAFVRLHEIIVDNESSGRPKLLLTGRAQAALADITPPDMVADVHISLSDEGVYALAFVVLSARPIS